MRLASFQHREGAGFGPVEGDAVIDVRHPGWPSLRDALADGGPAAIRAAAQAEGRRHALADVRLDPPIPNPDKILCVGLNYADHAAEGGNAVPEWPSVFLRLPSAQVGHDQAVIAPACSDTLDYEGELAVVIGRGGRDIPRRDALSHVVGYTIFAENSVREWQKHSRQVTPGKNFPRSGAVGPWITTAEDIPDPSVLSLQTRLNGTVVQQGHLRQLIFDVPALVAYCSTFTALLPGDVIATGTPAGVGMSQNPPRYLRPGDVVDIEIQPIGVLRHTVKAETQ